MSGPPASIRRSTRRAAAGRGRQCHRCIGTADDLGCCAAPVPRWARPSASRSGPAFLSAAPSAARSDRNRGFVDRRSVDRSPGARRWQSAMRFRSAFRGVVGAAASPASRMPCSRSGCRPCPRTIGAGRCGARWPEGASANRRSSKLPSRALCRSWLLHRNETVVLAGQPVP